MSNQVYSRYLYQMLMEFGSVSVPSLGTFALQYTEATFKNNKTLISPPSSKVVFTKDDLSAPTLKARLSESGMSVEDAALTEQLLVSDYLLTFKNNTPFELDGFGTVINNVFLTRENKYFNRYYGLNDIAIQSVAAPITHHEDYLYRLNPQSKNVSNSGLKNFLWPLLIGLFVSVFILAWFFSEKNTTSNIDTAIVAEKVEEPIEEITPILDDTLMVEDDDEADINNDTTDQVESDKSAETPRKSEANPGNETKSVEYSGNSCVVIVGSFKDSANANKLLKSIAAKGYKTYTAQYNGMKRVGVTYDCQTNEPDAFKSKVKKVFNKDAWYLHDTL